MMSETSNQHSGLDTEQLKRFPPDGCDHYAWLHYVLPLVEQYENLRVEVATFEDAARWHAENAGKHEAESTRLKEQLEFAQAALQQIVDLTGRGPMLAAAIARRALDSIPASNREAFHDTRQEDFERHYLTDADEPDPAKRPES